MGTILNIRLLHSSNGHNRQSLESEDFYNFLIRAQFSDNFEVKSTERITDTSREVFNSMINFFYKKDYDVAKCAVEDLFELMKVADKYEVLDLVEIVKKIILEIQISEKNVAVLANTAKNYEVLGPFTEVSAAAFQRCADYLSTTLKTTSEMCKFLAEERTDTIALEDSIKLLLVKAMVNSRCANCRAQHCLDGQVLTKPNLVEGGRVKVVTAHYYYPQSYGGQLHVQAGVLGTLKEEKFPIKFLAWRYIESNNLHTGGVLNGHKILQPMKKFYLIYEYFPDVQTGPIKTKCS